MKKRIPFRWRVAVMPRRAKARSATRRTSPQKNRDTDTRISPDVLRSAWRMASSIRRESIARRSALRVMNLGLIVPSP